MSRHLLAAALAAAASAFAMPCAAQEILTNDAVLTLSKAGLGDQILVAKIKESPNRFDVDSTQLIALKKQGLAEPVIAAMIEAAGRSATAVAMGQSDSPDPRSPHASGIYLLAGEGAAGRMVRMDATSSNQTKSGGLMGYALTGGLAKMKINTVVAGAHARVATSERRPRFFFFFDQANAGLSNGPTASAWLVGGAAPVTSPNEFSLVRFNAKKDHREASVGSFNLLGGAKSGVQDNQRVAITYKDVRPGVFEVTPGQELKDGEYGFIYSTATGGGVGAYGAGATMSRIFDFSVGAPIQTAQR